MAEGEAVAFCILLEEGHGQAGVMVDVSDALGRKTLKFKADVDIVRHP